jgi:hypothetical protein
MARDKSIEFQKLSATISSGTTPANFEGGIQQLYVTADAANCYICFDQPCVNTKEGILLAANVPFRFDFGASNVQNVYVETSSSTANVYLMGVRGR